MEILIDGLSPTALVKEFGAPLYVYEASTIKRQWDALNAAFTGVPMKVKYALKALNNPHVVKYLKDLGAGVDAVSYEEILVAKFAGFEGPEIMFTPNSVSIEEVIRAANEGVQINIDNISILEQFGHHFGASVPVCIRINPHILAGGNTKISTGHIDSKFGISIHQMRHVHRVVSSLGIRVNGLHMHTGSDILDAKVFLQGAEVMFELLKDFHELDFLDFGSGFKVAYREGDVTTDLLELGESLGKRFLEVQEEYGRPLELWFEPGKYLVSEAGHFLTKVNVIKQTTATVFVGVDSGQNHLIRPMFYDAYHSIDNVSNPSGTPRIYTVVGYICETDTFGWDRKLSEVREGDILRFKNAGAYGFTMASNYNARLRPAEVFIEDGKAKLIRRRETLEDLLNCVTPLGT